MPFSQHFPWRYEFDEIQTSNSVSKTVLLDTADQTISSEWEIGAFLGFVIHFSQPHCVVFLCSSRKVGDRRKVIC